MSKRIKNQPDESIVVFISHSSNDAVVARYLVTLLCSALNLPKSSLRCTSVPGCTLPAGADTPSQLLKDIKEARAFIGLITPVSIESAYVLFELGARWAIGSYFAPVLRPGGSYDLLKGPLAQRNQLKISERTDVQQLLAEVSKAVGLPLQPAQAYEHELDMLISTSTASERAIVIEKKEAETKEADFCPKCRKRGWELEKTEAHPEFDFAGISIRTYKCSLCGFSERYNYKPTSN